MKSQYIKTITKKLLLHRVVLAILELLQGILRILIFSGFFLLFSMVMDNIFHFSISWRYAIFLITVTEFIGLLWQMISHIFWALLSPNVITNIESRNKHEQKLLSHVLHLIKRREKFTEVEREVVKEAAERIKKFPLMAPFRRRDFRRKLIPATFIFIILSLYLYNYPDYFRNASRRILFPWKRIVPMTRVRIDRDIGELTAAFGESLEIEFKLVGDIVNKANIKISSEKGDYTREVVLIREEDSFFRLRLKRITEDFSFVIMAGDMVDGPHDVRVIPPPEINKSYIKVEKPIYSLESVFFSEKIAPSYKFPKNSKIELFIALDDSESDVFIYDRNSDRRIKMKKENQGFLYQEHLTEDRSFVFKYIAQNGSEVALLLFSNIEVVDDQLPTISINPSEIYLEPDKNYFDLNVSVNDDYGLKSWELLARETGQGEWRFITGGDIAGTKKMNTSWRLDYKQIADNQTDDLELQLKVKDNMLPLPNVVVSEEINVFRMSLSEYRIHLMKNFIVERNKLEDSLKNNLLSTVIDKDKFLGEMNLSLSKIEETISLIEKTGCSTTFLRNIENILLSAKTNQSDPMKISENVLSLVAGIDDVKDWMLHEILLKSIGFFKKELLQLPETVEKKGRNHIKILNSQWEGFTESLEAFNNWLDNNNELLLFNKLSQVVISLRHSEIYELIKGLYRSAYIQDWKMFMDLIGTLKPRFDHLMLRFISVSDGYSANKYKSSAIRKLIDRAEKVELLLSRLNLKSSDEELVENVLLLTLSIEHLVSNVMRLQKADNFKDLKGITILNNVIYELDGITHNININNKRAVRSQIKRARFNLRKFHDHLDFYSEKKKDIDKESENNLLSAELISPAENVLYVNKDHKIPIMLKFEEVSSPVDIWVELTNSDISNSADTNRFPLKNNYFPEQGEIYEFSFNLNDYNLLLKKDLFFNLIINSNSKSGIKQKKFSKKLIFIDESTQDIALRIDAVDHFAEAVKNIVSHIDRNEVLIKRIQIKESLEEGLLKDLKELDLLIIYLTDYLKAIRNYYYINIENGSDCFYQREIINIFNKIDQELFKLHDLSRTINLCLDLWGDIFVFNNAVSEVLYRLKTVKFLYKSILLNLPEFLRTDNSQQANIFNSLINYRFKIQKNILKLYRDVTNGEIKLTEMKDAVSDLYDENEKSLKKICSEQLTGHFIRNIQRFKSNVMSLRQVTPDQVKKNVAEYFLYLYEYITDLICKDLMIELSENYELNLIITFIRRDYNTIRKIIDDTSKIPLDMPFLKTYILKNWGLIANIVDYENKVLTGDVSEDDNLKVYSQNMKYKFRNEIRTLFSRQRSEGPQLENEFYERIDSLISNISNIKDDHKISDKISQIKKDLKLLFFQLTPFQEEVFFFHDMVLYEILRNLVFIDSFADNMSFGKKIFIDYLQKLLPEFISAAAEIEHKKFSRIFYHKKEKLINEVEGELKNFNLKKNKLDDLITDILKQSPLSLEKHLQLVELETKREKVINEIQMTSDKIKNYRQINLKLQNVSSKQANPEEKIFNNLNIDQMSDILELKENLLNSYHSTINLDKARKQIFLDSRSVKNLLIELLTEKNINDKNISDRIYERLKQLRKERYSLFERKITLLLRQLTKDIHNNLYFIDESISELRKLMKEGGFYSNEISNLLQEISRIYRSGENFFQKKSLLIKKISELSDYFS